LRSSKAHRKDRCANKRQYDRGLDKGAERKEHFPPEAQGGGVKEWPIREVVF